MKADVEDKVDFDINLTDDVRCFAIQWTSGEKEECPNSAEWRRKRHCSGPTRVYCSPCKLMIDDFARNNQLECAVCATRIPYNADRWTRL